MEFDDALRSGKLLPQTCHINPNFASYLTEMLICDKLSHVGELRTSCAARPADLLRESNVTEHFTVAYYLDRLADAALTAIENLGLRDLAGLARPPLRRPICS
jgi:hypothetical protein